MATQSDFKAHPLYLRSKQDYNLKAFPHNDERKIMLKLYYMPGACPLVPHTALEWAKAEYEAVNVPREQLKNEFLSINPLGSVPALQDGDWVLTENVAILDYINEIYPDAKLFGTGNTKSRAQARRWLAFANSDLHPTFGLVFSPNRYIDGEGEGDQIRARAILRVLDLYRIVNEELNGKDYLTGELTIADVYIYVTLRWAKAFELDFSKLDNIESYYLRVEANAGVQNALKQQGLL